MNESEKVKENSKSVWGASPAGSYHNHGIPGSIQFFNQALEYRFLHETPWLDEIVNFKQWRDKKVLEIGCGAGYDAYQFCKYGAHYTGIDITPANPVLVRKHLSHYGYTPETHEQDVEKMEYQGQFDLVYSFGVLHHVPDIKSALSKIYMALKPSGECIILVYNRNSFFYWVYLGLFGWVLNGNWRRMPLKERLCQIEFTTSDALPLVNVYSRSEINALVTAAGFVIKKNQVRKLTHADLPYIRLVSRLYKYIPQSWLDKLGKWVGWYLCVHAVKK